MFKVIAWATDGSPAAESALPVVKELVVAHHARLVVIHVDEIVVSHLGGGYRYRADEDEIQSRVGALVAQLELEGVTVDTVFGKAAHGEAASVIVDAANEADADLIVAGTRGLGTVAGLLLGSVTHRLLHIARCPVLVTPSV